MRMVMWMCSMLLLGAGATGCGGGGGDGDDGDAIEVTLAAAQGVVLTDVLNFDIFLDGFDPALLRVGDSGVNSAYYLFYTFDISSIPDDATIQDAELRTAQLGVVGAPYANLGGDLIADHIDGSDGIDINDLNSVALDTAFGILSSDPSPGLRTLDVEDQIEADLAANRTTSTFRIRFAVDTNSDGNNDRAVLEDSTGVGGTVPTLVITLSE